MQDNTLFIDVGNSYVHGWYQDQKKIKALLPFPSDMDSLDKGLEAIEVKPGTSLVFASVVPEISSKIMAWAGHKNIFIKQITYKDISFDIDVLSPENVGIDRLVNIMGAKSLGCKPPFLIVDCGSATTFDSVCLNGRFVGGAITVGIKMMTASLHKQSSLLPEVTLDPPYDMTDIIGKDTKSALSAGIYWSMVHLINGNISMFHAQNAEKSDSPLTVIGTGGGISLLKKDLHQIDLFEDKLMLEGLRALLP